MLRQMLALLVLVAPAGAQFRDVVATAAGHPFVTDAEVELHHSDRRGRVMARGGRILVRHPGITGLVIDGQPVPVTAVGADLLAADVPAGRHELEVVTGGAEPAAGEPTVEPHAVATPADWDKAIKAAGPGAELVVRDGVYRDWQLTIGAGGDAERPLVVRPETPGGVILRGASAIVIRGDHVVVRGFRFEHCGPYPAFHLADGSHCRVTQCQFFWCGNPRSTFANVVRVDLGCDANRVDHCYFTGSKSMSLAQRVTPPPAVPGRGNRFDHNLFRDIARYWVNGQENIQIGQNQRGASGEAGSDCLVEQNLFDHAWGDGEIISNKSSGNTIRYNLAAHCPRSAFTIRGGDGVRFEGNVMVNNGGGLRIIGRRHVVVNNLVVGAAEAGFIIETGSEDGSYVASEDSLIAHNTFLNCPSGAIAAMPTSPDRPFPPTRTTIAGNLALGCGAEPVSLAAENHSRVVQQLNGPAPAGPLRPLEPLAGLQLDHQLLARIRDGGQAGLVELDRMGRRRTGRPDLGADELEADRAEVELPELPAAPVDAVELYQEEACYDMGHDPAQGWRTAGRVDSQEQALVLTDGEATLEAALPDDLVLTWDCRAATYTATATLDFGEVQLSWGGVDKDEKPSGLIRLTRGDELLAEGCDAAQHYQNFRRAYFGRTLIERSEPDPKRWFTFQLVKLGGTLHVSQLPGAGLEPLPLMVWHEREQPLKLGNQLRLRQRGEGHWRAVRIWRAAYRGERPPAAPRDLRATAKDGRVALSWSGGRAEVFRAGHPDFPLDDTTRIAVCPSSGYDDFEVTPGQRYFYRVRSINRLGLASEAMAAEAVAPGGDSLSLFLPVTAAQLRGRLARGRALREYVWAPPGLPPATKVVPEADRMELAVLLPKRAKVRFWGLVQAPHEAADSFHIALDDQPWQVWYTGVHADWGWSPLGAAVTLPEGEHRLRIAYREPGTRLAAVLVTNDLTLIPAP